MGEEAMGYSERKSRKKGRSEDAPPLVSVFKSSLMGFAAALASALVLWIAASAIAYANDDPDSVVGALGLGVIYISALIGGFVSVRQNKKDALLCGIVSGAMLALCFFVISLFFADGSSSYSFLIELILRGAMLLMSVFGAFAGLNRGNKRRRRR